MGVRDDMDRDATEGFAGDFAETEMEGVNNFSTGCELWKLLVGDDSQFISPNILSHVTEFQAEESAASLFAAALEARPMNGVLKDKRLGLWLIDRLRVGVGWREDLENLNASFCDTLCHVEALLEGISFTTLLMALLECFDPSDVSVRCALLHMAARCGHPVPIVADAQFLAPMAERDPVAATQTPPALVYIGGLAYTVPLAEQRRMVLLLSSTSVIESRRDELLRNLFRLDERLQATRHVDSLNENMIELYVNAPLVKEVKSGVMQSCQLFVSNGRWDAHYHIIDPFMKAVPVIILSLTWADVADDGSLHDSALQQLVADNEGRLICVLNRGSSGRPNVAEQNRVSRFHQKQHLTSENCILLPGHLSRRTPDLMNTFQLFFKAVCNMVNYPHGETSVPVHWLDMQGYPQSMYQEEWLKQCNFAAKVRKELNNLEVDQNKSKHDLRFHIFPFSQAAQKAATKRNMRACKLRCTANANSAELLEIADQELEDFMKAANAIPHCFFLLFLSHLMCPEDIYFFERELEVWKSIGAIANLQTQLENTKKELDKAIEQRSNVKQLQSDVEGIYAQLDALDWSVSDFWREVRIIKGLPQRRLLDNIHMAMIEKKYGSIFIPMEAPNAVATLFKTLFQRGMTLDFLDGNLLSVDEDFLREVFNPQRSLGSLSMSSNTGESYFVVSMLGVQSTGKSTLLNNLFGCNMPVSVGRTTRGMNVSHVEVSLPNSSIRHIIVQDYEGLMTMDRSDSLFDKDVCLQALATSDLVLINTSRVIDSPTQQLLQYAAFAFNELGLQKYRELKPKLAFVLRDMANADTSAMAPAKRAMEMAIKNGFIETRRMKSNLELSDVMEVPEYVALASAIHRLAPFWQQSLLSLRQFIFKTMAKLDEKASKGRCFNNWVTYGVASWECIRSNTGLLHAKSLAELRLKSQMEGALHAALKSEHTVIKSENKAKGLMNLIIKNTETIDEQEIEFQTKLDVLYNQCLQLVKKEFEDRAGGEATIPEALVETWQEFRNQRTEREVWRSKNEMKLQWTEKLRMKHMQVSMLAGINTFIDKICTEAKTSTRLNSVEAEKHFNDLWRPKKLRFNQDVNKQYSEEEMKKKVDNIYALVCSKRYTDQPNDFDDLIDSKKEDLTVDLTVSLIRHSTKADSNIWRPFGFSFALTSSSPNCYRTEQTVKVVVADIQKRLRDAISSFSMSSSSLQNDIENAVQEVNGRIKAASLNGPAELGAWTSQLAKAAHRHLYRNVIARIASFSKEAREEQFRDFTNLEMQFKDNYVAQVTGKLKDVDIYQQITTKLSDALLKMATNPAHLGLRVNDDSNSLLSHFAISSPEMVEEKCYDDLFMRRNDNLLFKYITNRSATTESMWDAQYKVGEGTIRNLSYGKMDKIFSGPSSDYEKLKSATEEWFRQKDGNKQESLKNLLETLNQQFEFLRSDGHLVTLAISSISEVSSSRIKSLWPDSFTMICRARLDIDEYVCNLRASIKNLTYGCPELCPFCQTKCKYQAHHIVSHECHRHLITGFGGIRTYKTNHLDTYYCTGSAFSCTWHFGRDYRKSGTFYECLAYANKGANPTWKIAHEAAELPPLEQREAFKRLNTKIAAHFHVNPAETFW